MRYVFSMFKHFTEKTEKILIKKNTFCSAFSILPIPVCVWHSVCSFLQGEGSADGLCIRNRFSIHKLVGTCFKSRTLTSTLPAREAASLPTSTSEELLQVLCSL